MKSKALAYQGISFLDHDRFVRNVKNRIIQLENFIRAIFGLFVLRFLIDNFPIKYAYILIDNFSFLESKFGIYGIYTRRSIQKLLNIQDDQASQLATEYLARPFKDFVVLRRILNGYEDYTGWFVKEVNAEVIENLRASGKSFIIACGHFTREAFIPLYFQKTIPQSIHMLASELKGRSRSLTGSWQSFRFEQMLRYCAMERPDINILNPGDSGLNSLIRTLRKSRNVLFIWADAPWSIEQGKGHIRQFVGVKNRCFSRGVATLSRLSQCPIVTCNPYLNADGQVIIEWGQLIPPPSLKDKTADITITDLILDEIENNIQKRPAQYVLEASHIFDMTDLL
jgi:lauroyl/myristoyl acyltransferase